MGDDQTAPQEAHSVMDLLAEHVPLTLLADLATTEPRSGEILRAEGLPADEWWADGAPETHPA
ncbi:hypothetical protein [Cellulomonas sp. NPDC089187]|uniref:hypothetical protein n=1 Tax=Cellulomonas sp. NPDC089187 TaxID=3154970 RepID=UPI00342744BD